MLKAELEQLVEDQQATIEDLKGRGNVGVLYVAGNSPGQPVCYIGTYADDGLSVNIYRDENGNVQGVTVWDEVELLAYAGTITVSAEFAEGLD